MDIFYKLETMKTLSEVVSDLKLNLKENGFGTLFEMNFKDKIKEKGFQLNENFIMLEVCNPSIASEILNQNIEIGYLLPCKVVIYEKDRKNFIGLLKPSTLIDLVDKSFTSIAEEVELTLKEVLQDTV